MSAIHCVWSWAERVLVPRLRTCYTLLRRLLNNLMALCICPWTTFSVPFTYNQNISNIIRLSKGDIFLMISVNEQIVVVYGVHLINIGALNVHNPALLSEVHLSAIWKRVEICNTLRFQMYFLIFHPLFNFIYCKCKFAVQTLPAEPFSYWQRYLTVQINCITLRYITFSFPKLYVVESGSVQAAWNVPDASHYQMSSARRFRRCSMGGQTGVASAF